MIGFESRIAINRPVEDVFRFVADPLNGAKWNSAVVDVRKLSSGTVGVGMQYMMTRRLPRGLVENIIEIAEYVKDSKLTIRTTSGPTPFVYSYHFESEGVGTRLSLIARGEIGDTKHELGGLATLAPDFVLGGFVKRGVEANLRELKRILEP